MVISDEEGEVLVRLARRTIIEYLRHSKVSPLTELPSGLMRRSGVFTTIKKRGATENDLRGCIGYTLPRKPLATALVDATLAAAFPDPRFPPVKSVELDDVTFEVSVLTPPVVLSPRSPQDYPSRIKVGQDGLIVEWAWGSGFFFSPVAGGGSGGGKGGQGAAGG